MINIASSVLYIYERTLWGSCFCSQPNPSAVRPLIVKVELPQRPRSFRVPQGARERSDDHDTLSIYCARHPEMDIFHSIRKAAAAAKSGNSISISGSRVASSWPPFVAVLYVFVYVLYLFEHNQESADGKRLLCKHRSRAEPHREPPSRAGDWKCFKRFANICLG